MAEWYPQWRERLFFVPPVFMYRTHAETTTLSGQSVSVPVPPVSEGGHAGALQESDVKADRAQQRVLFSFRKFFEKSNEVMFILSELQFIDYLKDSLSAAAKTLPRPVDLKKHHMDRGDFDFLLLHRHYGLLALEMKAVGEGYCQADQKKDRTIKTSVNKAVTQLQTSKTVLTHLVSDLQCPPRVKACLLLPSISETQLQRVLQDESEMTKVGFCLTTFGFFLV